jgi:hypothetical protein
VSAAPTCGLASPRETWPPVGHIAWIWQVTCDLTPVNSRIRLPQGTVNDIMFYKLEHQDH